MQWSARTVQRRLAAHGIATIGTGRRARITQEDLVRLIEAERQEGARYSGITAAPLGESRSVHHLGRQAGRRIRKRMRAESVAALGPAGRPK